jgi:hypothetical protein
LTHKSEIDYCKQFVQTGIRVSIPTEELFNWLTIDLTNTMKRNSSDIEPSSPISSDSEDFKPDITPPPTSKAVHPKPKAPSTPSPKKKAKSSSGGSSGGGGGNGEWTPEKKAIFMDRVIATGYKGLDLGELAEEVCSTMYVIQGTRTHQIM